MPRPKKRDYFKVGVCVTNYNKNRRHVIHSKITVKYLGEWQIVGFTSQKQSHFCKVYLNFKARLRFGSKTCQIVDCH